MGQAGPQKWVPVGLPLGVQQQVPRSQASCAQLMQSLRTVRSCLLPVGPCGPSGCRPVWVGPAPPLFPFGDLFRAPSFHPIRWKGGESSPLSPSQGTMTSL